MHLHAVIYTHGQTRTGSSKGNEMQIDPNWHQQRSPIIQPNSDAQLAENYREQRNAIMADRDSMNVDIQALLNAIEHIVGLAYGVGTKNVPVENWRALERTAETIRGRRPA